MIITRLRSVLWKNICFVDNYVNSKVSVQFDMLPMEEKAMPLW